MRVKRSTKEYPFNMIEDILQQLQQLNINKQEELLDAEDVDINKFENALADVCSKCNHGDQIVKIVYKEGKTLSNCAKVAGVSTNRIGQIRNQMTRMMMHPSRRHMYLKGYKENEAIIPEKLNETDMQVWAKKIAQYIVDNNIDKEDMLEEITQYVNKIKGLTVQSLNIGLSDIGLSERTYNALIRVGKQTLNDLASMTKDDFMQLRNIGKRELEKAEEVLKKYGIAFKQ